MTVFTGKHGPFLIAEIGGNHEGDFEYAKRLTHLACQSGADSVKFQIYTGDLLVSPVESPQRNSHFKKFALSNAQYLELHGICKSYNVMFLASIWDSGALDFFEPYLPFFKIGSGDFTAYPLIKHICKYQKPIIISTGLCNDQEVTDTIEYIKRQNPFYHNPDHIALLQCTSMYPINDSDAHLNVMNSFTQKHNVTVGYSDHTEGSFALQIAVSMGAKVLEFHFTDDRTGKQFRDHKVSLTKEEVIALIDKIKTIKLLQGSAHKKPTEIEIVNDHVTTFRRSVYLNKDIERGATVREEDLCILRPNTGIDARQFDRVIGKKCKRNIVAFEKLSWGDFEPDE